MNDKNTKNADYVYATLSELKKNNFNNKNVRSVIGDATNINA